jgi:hypothetical protein
MRTFLCQLIGNGVEDDPLRPCIDEYVGVWACAENRYLIDRTMAVRAEPTADQLAAIRADSRIMEIE